MNGEFFLLSIIILIYLLLYWFLWLWIATGLRPSQWRNGTRIVNSFSFLFLCWLFVVYGLLRRFTPRNDKGGWVVVYGLLLFAMTVPTHRHCEALKKPWQSLYGTLGRSNKTRHYKSLELVAILVWQSSYCINNWIKQQYSTPLRLRRFPPYEGRQCLHTVIAIIKLSLRGFEKAVAISVCTTGTVKQNSSLREFVELVAISVWGTIINS